MELDGREYKEREEEGIAARGRWRSRIAWGDGDDQADCK